MTEYTLHEISKVLHLITPCEETENGFEMGAGTAPRAEG
jgi:hypothetical protein